MKIFSKYFTTLFGIGLISFAPGTFGSLIAIFIWYAFVNVFSIFYFIVLFLFILSVSFYFTDIYLENYRKKDPSEVVIDEFLGQSIPLLFMVNFNMYEVLIAFVTFRFFDIYKIYPINKMEDIRGSYGVILDDIVAGIYSLIVIMLYKIFV
jgi:phosphatidylglycerophosphatase A|tara:strand:+ start:42 stop:494 length:453 start_codon:yes stop_codon:yes gene_type:complete